MRSKGNSKTNESFSRRNNGGSRSEQLISDLNGVGENVALKIWNNHDKNNSIKFKLKKMYEIFLMN